MKKYLYISGLSVIAIINATYLSYKAYLYQITDVDFGSVVTFCDFSVFSSCSSVLKNPLSLVFGIPFPWIALVVYPVLLALALYGYKKQNILQAKIIAVLSALGVAFNGFIIYREAMYIHSYCLLCLMCTAIIISIFFISLSMLRKIRHDLDN